MKNYYLNKLKKSDLKSKKFLKKWFPHMKSSFSKNNFFNMKSDFQIWSVVIHKRKVVFLNIQMFK